MNPVDQRQRRLKMRHSAIPMSLAVDTHIIGRLDFFLIGGLFAVGFGLLMFAVHLFLISGSNQLALHSTTTLPILMGVFALTNAYQLFKTPHFVRLWAEGIEVAGSISTRLKWDQISRVSVEYVAMGQRMKIDLKDANDKTIFSIAGGLERFDVLANEIKSAVRPKDASAPATKPEAIHRKRGRLRAIGFIFGGLFTLFGFGFLLYQWQWMRYQQQQMETASVGTGVVTERKVAPDGRTKRLYVKIIGENEKQHTHNFEVEDYLYEKTEVGSEIEVTYVPADPRLAELTEGQVLENDPLKSPLGSILLAIAMACMSTMFWTMGILSWRGYDLKVENGRLALVPLGE
ncbi:MAG: DUF3592 domain-containing protein [Pirellulaceae bacterium]